MIDEAIDPALESRSRIAFDEMIPKLLADSSTETIDSFVDRTDELVLHHDTTSPRSRRGLAAAGLLVAASLAGLVVVAQRDRDTVTPTEPSTLTTVLDATQTGEPEWHRLLGPLIPQRFAYSAMTVRLPNEIHVMAIDSTDGKVLEIYVTRGTDDAGLTDVNATDDIGKWSDGDGRGWGVVTPDGLSVQMTCELGVPGRGYIGQTNYCDMEGVLPFTMDDIRAAVATAITSLDASVFDADLGPFAEYAFDEGAFDGQQIVDRMAAVEPDQGLSRDMDLGRGDRVLEFGPDEAWPDTSVRVLHGLYPLPPTTEKAAYALYNDAAAFWMLRADGVAVRMTTTDTYPESLDRLEQLGHDLLDGDALDLMPVAPPPTVSTVVLPPVTTLPDTTSLPGMILKEPLLLPTALPANFADDVADDFQTNTEGADPDPPGVRVRLFAGQGEQPPVVMLRTSPQVGAGQAVEFDEITDFTEVSSWPAFRFEVVRPSGRYDFLASGGLTAAQLQTVADAVGDIDVTVDGPLTLPFDLTEIVWQPDPSNAHDITWNATDGSIVMSVESSHGLDALLGVAISWPISAVDTSVGRVFSSVDPTDSSWAQVSLVIEGQAINIGAWNVPMDDVISVAQSIVPATDAEWARRIGT